MIYEYLLQRYSDNRESTLGLLFRLTSTQPFLMGYTLEDQFQSVKVSKETRIPAGRYEIVINRADTPLTIKYRNRYPMWFKFHLMLKDVPGFKGIYIHVGFNDDSTDGCITVGNLVNNNRVEDGEIRASLPCYMRIYSELYDLLDHRVTPKGPYDNQAFIIIRDEKTLTP